MRPAAAGGAGPGVRALGVALLLVPLLPLPAVFGPIDGAAGLVPPAEWLLGALLFGTVAWLLAVVPAFGRGAAAAGRLLERPWTARALPPAVALGLACLLAWVSWAVFRHRPLLVDSVIQLFQADIFATGRAWVASPPVAGAFAVQHMVVDAGRWYAQYPPGHSALLAVGSLLGHPWVVPPLLTVGTVLLLHRFVATAYRDRATAAIAALLAAASPFLWFMGASFMNHVSCLFFVTLALLLLAGWEEGGGAARLAGAGAALGAAFLSRPLTAVAVGVVLAGVAVGIARREGRWRDLVAGGAGLASVSAVYFAFNRLTTGEWLVAGYVKLWGAAHGIGFHESPWGAAHTPWTGLRNELVDLSLLNVHLFEWPIPSLWPLAALFALGWADRRWDRRLLLCLLAIPAAYFFYWHRDAYLGPRFLYAGLAFAVPLTARAIRVGADRLSGLRPAGRGALATRPVAVAGALLLLSLAYALAFAGPRRFQVYASGMASMKVDLAREARRAGLRDALVFVPVSWGNRLVARMRGAGLSASLSERAYRGLDHCDLELLVRSAETDGWPAARLEAALLGALEAGPPPPTHPRLNGDPTLRLRAGRDLPPACAEEIVYDRRGYTVYTPHLLANRPTLAGELVVARDLRGLNAEVLRRYPSRPAYVLRDGRFVPLAVDAGAGHAVGLRP